MNRAYLDNNAGAPLRPAARQAMIDALAAAGNASSVHAEGRAARRRIEEARGAVAHLVGADPRQVTFVSGGSEANATVLSPELILAGRAAVVDRLLVGATEHPSVKAGGRFAEDKVEALPVDGDGLLDLAYLRRRLAAAATAGERVLVSVMLANNETGAIQPVADIGAICREFGTVLHSDAVQAPGRIPVDIGALGVDFLTLSAHKLGGPQGAGAIIARSGEVGFAPLIRGGGQESRNRAGTENVAAIAGFGAAAREAAMDLGRAGEWARWRDGFADFAAEIGAVTVFSAKAPRLPQTLALATAGVTAETLVIGLDLAGVAISSGAACSSGKVGPSQVLAAMAVPATIARGAVRLSFGWETRETDLDIAMEAWRSVVRRILARKDDRAA